MKIPSLSIIKILHLSLWFQEYYWQMHCESCFQLASKTSKPQKQETRIHFLLQLQDRLTQSNFIFFRNKLTVNASYEASLTQIQHQ